MNNLKKSIAPFEQANTQKSIGQILNTILPFIGLWCLAYGSLSVSIWLTLLFWIPASGFLVRTFIIFHDCCHISFFKSKKANAFIGNITGILTTFPYEKWKFEHAVHHGTNGNLDRRGMGDIWTLTVDEYASRSKFQKFLYRLYRNPFILFGLGPIYILLIHYRFNRRQANQKERWNTHGTSLALLIILSLLYWLLGWKSVFLVEIPIVYLASIAGIWLFYIQHQFDDGYFEKAENWNYENAAMEGSSFYKLPKLLQWMSGNIGFHHVHHLSARVPNYHLQKASESDALIRNTPAIGFWYSFRSLRHRLWDEKEKKFVHFKDVNCKN